MTLIAVAVALAIPASPIDTPPVPVYFQRRRLRCDRGYSDRRARHGLRHVLRRPRPLSVADRARVRDLRVCAPTRSGRRGRERLAVRLRQWRHGYPQVWTIRFYRLPSWEQAWAWSTGACESGNNPTTSTGNGFYGAFQWVPSTWWHAGGDRWPTSASWYHQAVLAVRLMLAEGAGHWPVCGH